MKPAVIIPAFNPDEKLIELADDLKKMELPMVIVNDGSEPEYTNIFTAIKSRCGCEICCHPINIGKGAALKTGIQHAALTFPEACGYITADADGQHTAEDILRVAKVLERHPDRLVLGTRDFNAKNIPFKSKWGNRITSLVFLISTGKRCTDTQTGLRGIPKKLTETCLDVPGNRYEYEMNLLLELARREVLFLPVLISVIYLNGNQGSHFHPVKDSARIYLNIVKFSLSSLVSAITDLTLFTIFLQLIFGAGAAGILAATATARLISGSVNFMFNKHWVFRSKNCLSIEALKYLILFCSQMMLSWFMVMSLSTLPLNLTLIKIFVDGA
ncbi:MAG: glycosyltransferase family 2 protein, partial [Syntrophomonadaceae bacterium]|nr:glycosyltransferase family 2 protein [Syntrophomonadaceae bacterium]